MAERKSGRQPARNVKKVRLPGSPIAGRRTSAGASQRALKQDSNEKILSSVEEIKLTLRSGFEELIKSIKKAEKTAEKQLSGPPPMGEKTPKSMVQENLKQDIDEKFISSVDEMKSILRSGFEELVKSSKQTEKTAEKQFGGILGLTGIMSFMASTIASAPGALTAPSATGLISLGGGILRNVISVGAGVASTVLTATGNPELAGIPPAISSIINMALGASEKMAAAAVQIGEQAIKYQTAFVPFQGAGAISPYVGPNVFLHNMPRYPFLTPTELTQVVGGLAVASGGQEVIRTQEDAMKIAERAMMYEFGGGINRQMQAQFLTTLRATAMTPEMLRRGNVLDYEYRQLHNIIVQGFEAGFKSNMWKDWIMSAQQLTQQMNDLANTGIPLDAQSFTDFMSQAAKDMGLTPGYAARFTAGFARALAPSTPQQQMFELQAIGYQGGSIADYALAMARLSSPFQGVEGMAPVATRLIEAYQNMPGGQLALYQLLKNAGISDYNIYKYLQHPFTPHTIGQIQKDITERGTALTEGMTKREKEIYEKYGEEFGYRYTMEQSVLGIGEDVKGLAEFLRKEQMKVLEQIRDAISGGKQPDIHVEAPGVVLGSATTTSAPLKNETAVYSGPPVNHSLTHSPRSKFIQNPLSFIYQSDVANLPSSTPGSTAIMLGSK